MCAGLQGGLDDRFFYERSLMMPDGIDDEEENGPVPKRWRKQGTVPRPFNPSFISCDDTVGNESLREFEIFSPFRKKLGESLLNNSNRDSSAGKENSIQGGNIESRSDFNLTRSFSPDPKYMSKTSSFSPIK